jgi:hypothetical protein
VPELTGTFSRVSPGWTIVRGFRAAPQTGSTASGCLGNSATKLTIDFLIGYSSGFKCPDCQCRFFA